MKPIRMSVFVYLLLSFGVLFTTAAVLTDDEIANEIDTFVKKIMDCYSAPGITLSVVKSGKTIISRGYGNASNPTGKTDVKVTSKTRFAIGSLTKAFTALLAVKLVADSNGSITLDTPIQEFMPSFRVTDDIRSKEANLKDLLAHRMAIPGLDWPLLLGFPPSMTRGDLFRLMPFLPSPLTFRQLHIYNNYMYVAAGQVLEHLADGKSWEDLVRDVIFRPLNMSNSGFLTDVNAFVDFALPCYREENGSITDVSTDLFGTYDLDGPAGSIYSSADDMTKWMNLMLSKDQRANPSGLGPEVTNQTFQQGDRLSDGPMSGFFKPEKPVSYSYASYALGWGLNSYRGYRQIAHGGAIVTHGSRIWLHPDLDVGIFISSRGALDTFGDTIQSILFYASDLLIGEAPWFNASSACQRSSIPWRTKAELNAVEDLRKRNAFISNMISNFTATGTLIPAHYVGNYTHPFFGVVHIDYCADSCKTSLCFYYGKYGWMSLGATSETVFYTQMEGPLIYLDPSRKMYYLTVTFSLNNLGLATSLELATNSIDTVQYKRLDKSQ